MKRTSIILTLPVIIMSAYGIAEAKYLTSSEALERVWQDGSGPARIKSSHPSMVLSKSLKVQTSNQDGLYIFKNIDGEGFMVAPADDALPAVFGYSDKNSIDADNLAPGLIWLFNQYLAEVESAAEIGSGFSTRADYNDVSKAPIEALLKSQWDQNAPYNRNTPMTKEGGSRHSASGCVATAMAQIMYYYKYPAVGTGVATATWAGGEVSANLAEYAFDWDNMIDVYKSGQYSEEQGQAVADLMYACGLAVGSEYASTTTANTVKEVTALCENFGYSKEMRYYYHDFMVSESEWEDLIYASLSRSHPVAFAGGEEDGGGHSFVCDGYDGNGYYHFNWGWGGDSDGYFLLNQLNPKNQGTGGSADGYNDRQLIITDIHPAEDGETFEYQQPIFWYRGDFVFNDGVRFNGSGRSNGKSTGFYNRSPYSAEFYFGIYIVDSDGNGQFKMKDPKTYAYGKGTTGMTFSTLGKDLGDGVYDIYPIYFANDDQYLTYMYHEVGKNDYLTFTIVNDEIVSVEPGYSETTEPGAVASISDNGIMIIADSQTGGIRIEGVSTPTDVNIFTLSGEAAIFSQRITTDRTIALHALSEDVYIVVASNRTGIATLKFRKK